MRFSSEENDQKIVATVVNAVGIHEIASTHFGWKGTWEQGQLSKCAVRAPVVIVFAGFRKFVLGRREAELPETFGHSLFFRIVQAFIIRMAPSRSTLSLVPMQRLTKSLFNQSPPVAALKQLYDALVEL